MYVHVSCTVSVSVNLTACHFTVMYCIIICFIPLMFHFVFTSQCPVTVYCIYYVVRYICTCEDFLHATLYIHVYKIMLNYS